MPINRLYDTWKRRIMELRPDQRITQCAQLCVVDGRDFSKPIGLSAPGCPASRRPG